MEIDGQAIKSLFEYAEKVYKGEISLQEAKEQLLGKGFDEQTAHDYLTLYRSLLSGKIFKGAINAPAMRYYLDQIFETKGIAYLQNAMQSLSLHIDHYEDHSGWNVVENKEILNDYLALFGFVCDQYFEETMTDYAPLKEGLTKQITVNLYERNAIARSKSIEFYGAICQVCDFNFEIQYGPIGKGFIHIHHVVDISTIDDDYEVDYIEDLKPVCPNCHAMLHTRKPAYMIKELREIINKDMLITSYAKHWGFGGIGEGGMGLVARSKKPEARSQ